MYSTYPSSWQVLFTTDKDCYRKQQPIKQKVVVSSHKGDIISITQLLYLRLRNMAEEEAEKL